MLLDPLLDTMFDKVVHLPPTRTRKVQVDKNIGVPMDDGAVLVADHYWPGDSRSTGSADDPVVLMRTPYGRASFMPLLARAFAARGAQVVMVSCRGTFGSAGEWMPMRDEAPDSLATYRWLEAQPWFGGQVVLAGYSYLGYTQWALATQIPDRIAAMVPHVTSSRLTMPFVREDALDWDLLVRWHFGLEHQEDSRAALRSALKLDEKRVQQALLTLPRETVDQDLAGHRWQFFQDCLRHSTSDPHWRPVDHSGAVATTTTPASYVAGWYDIFLQDQLRDHAATMAAGTPHRLTIGPWVHGSSAGLGAAAAETLYFALPLAKGRSPGERALVRLYIMGTGEKGSPAPGIAVRPPEPWRDFDRWPPGGYRPTRLHLTPTAGLTVPAPTEGGPDAPGPSHFRYDPADPTPSCGGPFLGAAAGPKDNRPLEKRDDVLTFTTEPLTADVEVIGEVSAEIWFASDLGSADVFVRLCDVEPSGRSTNICDGIVGIASGSDTETAVMVPVTLWPTAYRFRRGHRIRVQVSSGSHPRYALNPGTGEPRASATRMLIADQRVWHDADHPSAIVLPVADAHRATLT
ncbi:putative CocE/NonD family hydrolase [Nakamurella sp. UYEF19]|uniref:CocE/NonD family hydrolase n=1 Tax=Nakamurella sp. UYEF19 TaxID=1756392 RepID=UPI003391BAE4